jgi:hypothetical protein
MRNSTRCILDRGGGIDLKTPAVAVTVRLGADSLRVLAGSCACVLFDRAGLASEGCVVNVPNYRAALDAGSPLCHKSGIIGPARVSTGRWFRKSHPVSNFSSERVFPRKT